MPQSEQINELATALAAAQQEMVFAKKEVENSFFKSSYADLAAVWEVCRSVLPKNGLAVAQTLDHRDGNPVIVTTLMHKSGQWISGECLMLPAKKDPQGIGSAITYARRYSLAAIVGVIADDDDGEAAMGRGAGGTQGATQPAKTAARPKPVQSVDPLQIIESAPSLPLLKDTWTRHFDQWAQRADFAKLEAAKDKRKAELEAQ